MTFKERHADFISEVRGLGLMLGVECKRDCLDLVNLMMSKGVLTNCTNGNVIRILPPLIIEEVHVDSFMTILEETSYEIFSPLYLRESTSTA